MADWPWQPRSVELVQAAIKRGGRRLALTLPTGAGKTRVAGMLITEWLGEGHDTIFFTSRKILLEQTARALDALGVVFGVRAAGTVPEHHHRVQVASLPTEHSRVVKAKTWETTPAKRVIVDEIHLHVNNSAAAVFNRYLDNDAVIVGLSASPVGLAMVADELIQPTTLEECRRHGALVLGRHVGCGEPDPRRVKWTGENLGEDVNRKLMGSLDAEGRPDARITKLHGRVFSNWRRLNPAGTHTLLFAPGVKESVWFAQQFEAQGVRAAHIDGDDVYVDGEFIASRPETREEVFDDFRRGKIQVLCNRFVLREGVDIPEVRHVILACVIGSVQGYVQIVGRGARAAEGKEFFVLQDHGGHWLRHGSPNAERLWRLDFDGRHHAALREERLREKAEAEPFCCPNCGLVLRGRECHPKLGGCGYVIPPGARSRPVVTDDGELVELRGEAYAQRRRTLKQNTEMLWTRYWIRGVQSKMTFKQIEALFYRENYYYPERTLALMPRELADWLQRVRDVKDGELIGPVPAKMAGWREKAEAKRRDREAAPEAPEDGGLF